MTSPRSGFTIIELLVVIAIISLLSSIVFAGVSQARSRARDSKRLQDIVQVRNALELYKSDHGRYPPPYYPIDVVHFSGSGCWDCAPSGQNASWGYDPTKLGTGGPFNTGISPYLPQRPSDPLTPPGGFIDNQPGTADSYRGYWYKVDQNGTDYNLVIFGTIEIIASAPQHMIDTTFIPTVTELQTKTLSFYSSDRSKNWKVSCSFLTTDCNP